MKKIHLFLATIAIIILAICAVACGSQGGGDSTTSGSSSDTSAFNGVWRSITFDADGKFVESEPEVYDDVDGVETVYGTDGSTSEITVSVSGDTVTFTGAGSTWTATYEKTDYGLKFTANSGKVYLNLPVFSGFKREFVTTGGVTTETAGYYYCDENTSAFFEYGNSTPSYTENYSYADGVVTMDNDKCNVTFTETGYELQENGSSDVYEEVNYFDGTWLKSDGSGSTLTMDNGGFVFTSSNGTNYGVMWAPDAEHLVGQNVKTGDSYTNQLKIIDANTFSITGDYGAETWQRVLSD